MAKYQSTKTYGNDRGLSCCFRQWRSVHSHCSTLHGYSLGFKFIWESETLDDRNWVFDFGGMKPIKEWLDYMFDHTILVSHDDPAIDYYKQMELISTNPAWNGLTDDEIYALHNGPNQASRKLTPHEMKRICSIRYVPAVGCEATAKLVYDASNEMLEKMKAGQLGRYQVNPDVRLHSVECFEHGANSAIYLG